MLTKVWLWDWQECLEQNMGGGVYANVKIINWGKANNVCYRDCHQVLDPKVKPGAECRVWSRAHRRRLEAGNKKTGCVVTWEFVWKKRASLPREQWLHRLRKKWKSKQNIYNLPWFHLLTHVSLHSVLRIYYKLHLQLPCELITKCWAVIYNIQYTVLLGQWDPRI